MKKIFWLVGLTILIILAYAYFIGRQHVQINFVTIESTKLRAGFKANIVQISDLHISRLGKYERSVAQKVNALQPDFIVITGDFFKKREFFEKPNSNEFAQSMSGIKEFLKMLSAEKGIFVCRGNNDFGNDKEVSDLFLDAMEEIGVTVLCNSTVPVEVNGDTLYLLGVDYPEFYKLEVADFYIAEYKEGQCLQINESERNSYSHLLIRGDRSRWRNYTFSGKFRQSDPLSGGIGVTFYSQFDRGYDRFYRLRRSGGDKSFILSPHGAEPPIGDIYADTEIAPNVWYRFRVECRNLEEAVFIAARVWPQDEPEPENWQIQAVDSTMAFVNGSVGLWSHGQGSHQFDDLLVVDNFGDTLLYKDFENGKLLQDPFGWVDFNYEREAILWLMQEVPEETYSILLAHSPDMITWAAPAGVDLQLSGHTHGGQIQIPFFGPLIVRTALGRKVAEGLHQFDKTTLYVNRGIGTVLLPLRLACRPEITMIKVKSKVK